MSDDDEFEFIEEILPLFPRSLRPAHGCRFMQDEVELRNLCLERNRTIQSLRKQVQRAKSILSRTQYNTKESNKELKNFMCETMQLNERNAEIVRVLEVFAADKSLGIAMPPETQSILDDINRRRMKRDQVRAKLSPSLPPKIVSPDQIPSLPR